VACGACPAEMTEAARDCRPNQGATKAEAGPRSRRDPAVRCGAVRTRQGTTRSRELAATGAESAAAAWTAHCRRDLGGCAPVVRDHGGRRRPRGRTRRTGGGEDVLVGTRVALEVGGGVGVVDGPSCTEVGGTASSGNMAETARP
jgi:hypothetical protein